MPCGGIALPIVPDEMQAGDGVTATYWVQVADELLETMDPSLLPDGLRMTEPVIHAAYGTHWQQFEDDNAPDELDGKRVELVLGRQGRMPAKAVIIERRVIA